MTDPRQVEQYDGTGTALGEGGRLGADRLTHSSEHHQRRGLQKPGDYGTPWKSTGEVAGLACYSGYLQAIIEGVV